jgi:hypothetical protein
MTTTPLVLAPVLVGAKPGVFTSMLGRHAPSTQPAAFLWPSTRQLTGEQEQALVGMGHLNPSSLAAVLDADGYGSTAALHTCAQTVWQRLRTLSKDMWHARSGFASWRWWVLRDGFVGMPYVVRDVFLPKAAWGDLPLPESHTGVPILVMDGAGDSAHARLATTARLVEDFTLVCGRDFPYTSVSSPLWLP